MKFKEGDRVLYSRGDSVFEGILTDCNSISGKYTFTVTHINSLSNSFLFHEGSQFIAWGLEELPYYSLIEENNEEVI
jgi:hypothetical protein